ncbi:MAG TPA: hypothetical protein VMU33_06150 [Burkholderiaceae bacterium]|nr:hypothetical protein [Burkholderiaceae bacterium]
MWTSIDCDRAGRATRSALCFGILRLTLLGVTTSAAAAPSTEVDVGAPIAATAPAPAAGTAGTSYILRCWQFGRLILEEIGVQLPPSGPPSGSEAPVTRLKLLDATNQPYYLAETRNATCVLRARRAAGMPGVAP